MKFIKLPSSGAFSGIAGCTPSIANQWIDVLRGAFGKGASSSYWNQEICENKISGSNSTTSTRKEVLMYLQNSYIFNIHIFVINVEQILVPSSSFEAQRIIWGETIYRLIQNTKHKQNKKTMQTRIKIIKSGCRLDLVPNFPKLKTKSKHNIMIRIWHATSSHSHMPVLQETCHLLKW